MGHVFLNQRGNIAIAMLLAVIGLLSASSMGLLVMSDLVSTQWDYETVQCLHLLRSESARGNAVINTVDYNGSELTLPDRKAEVIGSNYKNTFNIRTKLASVMISSEFSGFSTNNYVVKSLVTTVRGARNSTNLLSRASIIKKYGEVAYNTVPLAVFQYFSENDASPNNTNVYFWGPDEFWGVVRSNSSIWIKQAGGGNNAGWPTFHKPVYVVGTVNSFSGNYPVDDVFEEGLYEHSAPLDYDPTATDVRAHGQRVGLIGDGTICFITVNGPNYSSLYGRILTVGRDTMDVWSVYPPPSGNYMYRNQKAHLDTVWVSGSSGTCTGRSFFADSKLWIKGNFMGRQTWACSDTMYLADDITLAAVPKGVGHYAHTGVYKNTRDMVGLISEKSILIQYGYKNPTDSVRYRPNCDGDAEGIFIYAALVALGRGENGDSHGDGVFTFEYQHPHPATPSLRINNILYRNIDMHKRRYPQTLAAPWPPNIDYPYYNPLWPELNPYLERGTIHLYGSVAQRRRGYVHRNYVDSEYQNPDGVWNPPIDWCGIVTTNAVPLLAPPTAGVTLNGQAVNAPGTANPNGTGYRTKDYVYDSRWKYISTPDFPACSVGGKKQVSQGNWVIKYPEKNF